MILLSSNVTRIVSQQLEIITIQILYYFNRFFVIIFESFTCCISFMIFSVVATKMWIMHTIRVIFA